MSGYRPIVLFAAIALIASKNASAASRFSLVAIQNYSVFESQGVRASPLPSLSGGAFLEIPAGNWHLEIGTLYLRRQWKPDSASNYVMMPLSWGVWLTDNLGFSAGTY